MIASPLESTLEPHESNTGTKPSMVITAEEGDSGSTSNVQNLNLIFTVSEDTESFEFSDISVSGGTLSSFAGSGSRYTATLVGNADIAKVQVENNKFTDFAGNANSAVEFIYNIDTVHPTVTIEATEGISGFSSNDDSLNLQFTVSEDTVDFEQSDITASGGVLSSFQGSGRVYIAVFTPNSNSVETSIQINHNMFHDTVGNGNEVIS